MSGGTNQETDMRIDFDDERIGPALVKCREATGIRMGASAFARWLMESYLKREGVAEALHRLAKGPLS